MSTYFAFTNLPPELQLRVSTYLSRRDLRSLSRTSHYLFSLTSRDLLIADLQHHRSNHTLLCCLKYPHPTPAPTPIPASPRPTPAPYIYPKRSRALQIEQAPGPFLIRHIEIGTSRDPSRPGPIKLHTYRPVFFRPDANERPLDIRIDLSAVSLVRQNPKEALIGTGTVIGPAIGAAGAVPALGVAAGAGDANDIGGDWFVDASRRRDATRDEIIEYGAGVCAAGKLALLTARMLRASYTCPECRGARFLKRPAERDMFLLRYVRLLIPIPLCLTISLFNVAPFILERSVSADIVWRHFGLMIGGPNWIARASSICPVLAVWGMIMRPRRAIIIIARTSGLRWVRRSIRLLV